MSYYFDTLIIGSGISGLNLARKLAQAGQSVFICSKEAVTEGSSKYAQGGVAVVSPWNPEDKLESHIQDTMRAGQGLCRLDVVEAVLSSAWKRVEEFIGLGVKFDKGFSLEGSHSFKRVLHVADATGRALMKPLLDNVSCNFNISISQGTEALSLIKSEDKVVGAELRTVSGENVRILARNTVLASGGFAALYKDFTTPNILTGDGHMLAYDAGAELENLEFVQFHPTVFFTDDKRFLISEVVRGAGATLKNIHGEAFMHNYDKRAELATRDVVSRAIEAEMKRTNSDFVYLDMTCWSSEEIEAQFPNINHFCSLHGFDISKEMLPVKPAAHYSVGGVKTDINGRTSVAGLYAIGEIASTGLHGANRLASNSLLECIVMPEFLANDILNSTDLNTNIEELIEESFEICSEFTKEASFDQRKLEENNLEQVRTILSRSLGLVRSKYSLEEALKNLENLDSFKSTRLAELIVKAALIREESRGCHYREDFPEMNQEELNNYSKKSSNLV